MDFETAALKETGEEVSDKSEDAMPALKERDLTVLHCYKDNTPEPYSGDNVNVLHKCRGASYEGAE